MTHAIERARSRRPVTWLTLIGVLLLPAVIGGILVAALNNPTENLDNITAAIVNDDDPVTIDDQLVPLGRQLTAGLVEGSDELDSNLDWTITNDSDAASGLADGTYAAVITIPENFSAAATSTAPGNTPEQATIEVTTAPDALIVDDAITAQVTNAAASLTGQQLSEVYLQNVFLGFTTLGDQLGEAADGADDLADGARSAQDGAVQLADGTRSAQSGAGELASGASQLATGTGALASGAGTLAGGLGDLSAGISSASSGATEIANGVDAGASQILANGLVPAELLEGAQTTSSLATTTSDGVAGLTSALQALSDACAVSGGVAAYCAQVDATLAGAQQLEPAAAGTAQAAAGTSGGLSQFAAAAPQSIADQLSSISGGVRELGSGLDQLADGAAQSQAGASDLQSGAGQIQTGVSGLSLGASELGSGLGELATGVDDLGTGIGELANGTDTLADGLHTAVDELPSYTDTEAETLASVVADPVSAQGIGSSLFGAAAIPLLATLALWFGGVASFIALQAVSRRALVSTRASASLALRSLAPAALIGIAQGLLVAIVVQISANYTWGEWSQFAMLCMIAGLAFAAVNQALMAVLGGFGRWLAALIGVLAVATSIVSTVPGSLRDIASLMPTAPAYNAMLGALTSSDGVAAGVVALLVWALLAYVATTIATAQRRKLTPGAVAEASAA